MRLMTNSYSPTVTMNALGTTVTNLGRMPVSHCTTKNAMTTITG